MPAPNTTTIRMDDYTKAVLDSAAKYTNQTRTAFMLSVAVERAEQVIQERSATLRKIAPMVLDAEDSKIFLEALGHDFKPTQETLDLKKHHDSLNVVDRT